MRAELKEYQAVEAAAMNFVKSVAEGDSTHAKKLFIDEAVLFGYLDGELEHGSIEQFYHNVDTVPGKTSRPAWMSLTWRRLWLLSAYWKRDGVAVSTLPISCC